LNQKSLVNAKIIDCSREYIAGFERSTELQPLELDNDDAQDNLSELKAKIVTMLTSLLEGEVDQEIINRMAMSLDFSAMKSRLLKVFAKFAENILEWDRDEPINVKDLPLI